MHWLTILLKHFFHKNLSKSSIKYLLIGIFFQFSYWFVFLFSFLIIHSLILSLDNSLVTFFSNLKLDKFIYLFAELCVYFTIEFFLHNIKNVKTHFVILSFKYQFSQIFSWFEHIKLFPEKNLLIYFFLG